MTTPPITSERASATGTSADARSASPHSCRVCKRSWGRGFAAQSAIHPHLCRACEARFAMFPKGPCPACGAGR